jgi:flagellar protein FliO/FliZ
MRRLHSKSSLHIAVWSVVAATWVVGAGNAGGQDAASTSTLEGASTLEFAEPPSVSAAAGAMPLLSYRRSDDTHEGANGMGANPLRPSAPAMTPPTQAAIEEMTPGEPRYAMPTAALEETKQANVRAEAGAPAGELPPAPAAPLDDYDAAPLAEYKGPVASPALSPTAQEPVSAPPSTPTAPGTSAGVGSSITSPTANSMPRMPRLGSSEDAADRRLAPRSAPRMRSPEGQRTTAASLLPAGLGQFKGLASAGAGLAIVIALFLLFAWTMRRGGPKPSGMLPEAAFAVLGRAPLTSQSFAQLLRVGNKLVLVAMSADGAQPLAEVTDPLEVDRIAGLCVAGKPNGSSAEFQQVLAQLSKEPARGFLGREASPSRRRA